MDNTNNIMEIQTEDAAKIDALLQKVVVTPEGSTAIFTNYYCTDRASLDAMKSDPAGMLLSVIGKRCKDQNTLDEMRQRMDQGRVNVLQNEENRWHIVLPPRNAESTELADDYLEKISGGEVYISLTAAGLAIGVGSAFWISLTPAALAGIALAAGAVAVATVAVGTAAYIGGLAISGDL